MTVGCTTFCGYEPVIKRLYIDNYKCFVNFKLGLQRLNLFLGENGSGKSTLFEVVRLLRSFLISLSRSRSLKKMIRIRVGESI